MISKLEVQYCLEALNGKPVPKRFPEARDSVVRFLNTAASVASTGRGDAKEIRAFQMVQATRDISTPRKRVVLGNFIDRISGLPDRRPQTYRARPIRKLLVGLRRQLA